MAHVTVPADTAQRIYIAASGERAFAVPFPFFALADLRVYVNGVLQSSSAYTAAGTLVDGGYQSGTVTMGTAPGLGAVVAIVRDTPVARSTDFPYPSTTLDIRSLNTDLDKLFGVLQERTRDNARQLRISASELSIGELPAKATRANRLLGFDANGEPVATVPEAGSLSVTPYALGLLSAASDVAAVGVLNLSTTSDLAKGDALIGAKLNATGSVAHTVHAAYESGIINAVTHFGMVPGGADCTAALQAAINAADTKGARSIYIPSADGAGYYGFAGTVTQGPSARSVTIFGDGQGTGASAALPNDGTRLYATTANLPIMDFTTRQPINLRGLFFGRIPTATSGGNGVNIKGVGTTSSECNGNSRVDDCAFVSQWDGLFLYNVAFHVVTRNSFMAWVNNAMTTEGTASSPDVGDGTFSGNNFFGVGVTGSETSCWYAINPGAAKVIGNKFLGGGVGFRMLSTLVAGTGTVVMVGNSLEESGVASILLSQTGSATYGNFQVVGNQFSNLDFVSAFQGHVVIQAGAASWISNVLIAENVSNSAISFASGHHYNIASGDRVRLVNNHMNNLGVSGARGIAIGAQAAAARVLDNEGINFPSGVYSTLQTTTLLRDMSTAFTAAGLPSVANGSMAYATDGTFGSNPLTGGGGGTFARRIGGAWVGT